MAAAAICALGLMPLVIRARALGHDRLASPQHVHREPTSRLGGGIVCLAFVAGVALVMAVGRVRSPPLAALLACALPVLLAGLWEDAARHLSPRRRLVAAALSGLLASAFAGGIIARLDFPFVDGWLDYRPFAILLTCFMVMGACNALNLIDGAHGLLGGTALLMFAGLAGAADHVGDRLVFVQAVGMIGALAGFLCWNYPRGRVFMGDGGAYFVGFVYAQMSIQIVARNEHLSAWFVIMLAAYPIVETLYSIFRRKILLRTPSTQPDALHLHSLLYRRLALPAKAIPPEANPDLANARVAPRLWLHGALCCLVALAFHDNSGALIAGLAAYAAFYHWHYRVYAARRAAQPVHGLSELQEQRDGNAN
jgi:UDP-N-acetylmuramyl pentapeptide phosphotransferase/UDP-N-acetylglucosamine-1-phosphate transferase